MTLAYYLISFAIIGVAYLLTQHFAGEYIGMHYHDLIGAGTAGIVPGLHSVWYLFIFAIVSTLAIHLLIGTSNVSAVSVAIKGTWISLLAGFFEELFYRWMLFFIALVLMPFLNFILGGFIGFNIVQLVYSDIVIPFVNFVTFHQLQPQLIGRHGWVFGAAIVTAAGWFRDAHTNHKWWGKIVVWYVGMLMFLVMFHYGIYAAMAAHALYDLLIFWTSAVLIGASGRSYSRW